MEVITGAVMLIAHSSFQPKLWWAEQSIQENKKAFLWDIFRFVFIKALIPVDAMTNSNVDQKKNVWLFSQKSISIDSFIHSAHMFQALRCKTELECFCTQGAHRLVRTGDPYASKYRVCYRVSETMQHKEENAILLRGGEEIIGQQRLFRRDWRPNRCLPDRCTKAKKGDRWSFRKWDKCEHGHKNREKLGE